MSTTLISFVIVLGAIIFIHELGHFVVAKLSGVGVEKFSLGFGPRLIGFTRGETEYKVSLLPLGGYVKMVGEHADEEVAEEQKEKSFTHKPLYKRAAIVVAGSAMNIVLAFLLFPFIYWIGTSEPVYLDDPPVISYVTPGGAGESAGLVKGDLIETVNGKRIADWETLEKLLFFSPGKELRLRVRRDAGPFDTALNVKTAPSGLGFAEIYYQVDPVVGGLEVGRPAEKAGMKLKDRILAVDGTPITHWNEFAHMVMKNGKEMEVTVEREGKRLPIKVTPDYIEEAGVYRVGIRMMGVEEEIKKYGFIGGIGKGFSKVDELTRLLFYSIKMLVLGELSVKTLGGPILIAQVAGAAAESGVVAILSLIAFLSLQIGIINLFPIPVLDGGHLCFFLIEKLRGRPLSERFMTISQQVGIVMLISLMLLVTWNDILRLFK